MSRVGGSRSKDGGRMKRKRSNEVGDSSGRGGEGCPDCGKVILLWNLVTSVLL